VTARVRPIARSVAIVAGAGAIWAASTTAQACSCSPPRPPLESAAQAVAVFEGRTFGVQRDGVHNRFTFEVLRVWKGEVSAEVQIYSASQSATCGRAFEAGLPYLVYAYEMPGGVLGDGLCSRTRPIANAAEDLELLGAGHAPLQAATTDGAEAPPVEPPRIEPLAQQTAASPSKRGCAIDSPPSFAALLWLGLLGCARRRARRGV
jgi:hypothetical protein